MTLAWYTSGHGFGHASRDVEIINALGGRRPDVRIVMRTSVAPAFVLASATVPLDVHAAEVDTGVAQIDSLTPDEDRTARDAARFYEGFDARADAEAAWLREAGATLVVGDIPPLAFAAAARAGVPSIAIGNFTWDWIYGAYPRFAALAPGVIETIRDAYARSTLALRMPLHGGFDPMRDVVRDIPLVARRSARGRADVRRLLALPSEARVVLPSFGGFGLALPLDTVATDQDFVLLTDDANRMRALGLRYEDLVAAADVVVSKMGYGIVSECIANGTALVYAARGRFIEQDVFVREMPRALRCREIAADDLRAGRWGGAVDAVLRQPPPAERWPIDGADAAAERIAALC
jgi:L-arabinokinase